MQHLYRLPTIADLKLNDERMAMARLYTMPTHQETAVQPLFLKWRILYTRPGNQQQWLTITCTTGLRLDAERAGRIQAPRGWVMREVRAVRSTSFS